MHIHAIYTDTSEIQTKPIPRKLLETAQENHSNKNAGMEKTTTPTPWLELKRVLSLSTVAAKMEKTENTPTPPTQPTNNNILQLLHKTSFYIVRAN